MKTQITTLINGSNNVIRDLSHSKYATAPKGSSAEFGGTNYSIRSSVAKLVHAENESSLHVVVRGVELQLARNTSSSPKDVNYSAKLTEAQYLTITGYHATGLTYEASFSIYISHDLIVSVSAFTKSAPLATWKERSSVAIGEEFVTIL